MGNLHMLVHSTIPVTPGTRARKSIQVSQVNDNYPTTSTIIWCFPGCTLSGSRSQWWCQNSDPVTPKQMVSIWIRVLDDTLNTSHHCCFNLEFPYDIWHIFHLFKGRFKRFIEKNRILTVWWKILGKKCIF